MFFFEKEHILISWRYELYPASAKHYALNGIQDAHSQKKKGNTKKNSGYRDRKLETATLTPPRQHQTISFSVSNASKKETVHKYCRRPIIDLRFSP
jgi:hypothetical protein